MKIMKSHIKAGLILLAAFAAGPLAFGQGLQMTPRDAYESIPTRTGRQRGLKSLVTRRTPFQGSGAASRIDALQARAMPVAIRDGSSNPDTNAELPASVDLRKYLPTPGKQKGQNDCVGWALGYSSYSCQICQERNRAPIGDYDKFSPTFIYSALQKEGKGLIALEAIKFVKKTGCASLATMPQHADSATEAALIEAATFCAADHERAENLADIKAYLHDGFPVMLVVFLDTGFMNYDADSSPYQWDGTKTHGLHAISAVGYDDEKQRVLIMNSSGPEWKDKGFCWVSYETLKSISGDNWCVEAYVVKVKDSHPITVHTRVKGRFQRHFTIGTDHDVYENKTMISPSDWQLDDMVYAKDGLFVLRDNRTLALMSEDASRQNRQWQHLNFGPLQNEVIAMLAADPSSLVRVLTEAGDVFEHRSSVDTSGVWQKINPPSSETSKTIDLRITGILLRATNVLGQVHVYDNNGDWKLAK